MRRRDFTGGDTASRFEEHTNMFYKDSKYAMLFAFKLEHCGCTLKNGLFCVANTPADIATTFYLPHQLWQMTNTLIKQKKLAFSSMTS